MNSFVQTRVNSSELSNFTQTFVEQARTPEPSGSSFYQNSSGLNRWGVSVWGRFVRWLGQAFALLLLKLCCSCLSFTVLNSQALLCKVVKQFMTLEPQRSIHCRLFWTLELYFASCQTVRAHALQFDLTRQSFALRWQSFAIRCQSFALHFSRTRLFMPGFAVLNFQHYFAGCQTVHDPRTLSFNLWSTVLNPRTLLCKLSNSSGSEMFWVVYGCLRG